MARQENDSAVTLSIIDRLIDSEPGNQAEAPLSRSQSVRQMKTSLRRDLEWLLNTRRTPNEFIDQYPQLNRSLYNYGLPDFTQTSVNAPRDRVRLQRALETAISIFEPRLTRVKVSLREEPSVTRQLRFHIDALLRMDPAPEQISFDTVLSLSSGEYKVKGESGA